MKKLFSMIVLLAAMVALPLMASEPRSQIGPRAAAPAEPLAQWLAMDMMGQSGWAGGDSLRELAGPPPFTPGIPHRPILEFEREILVDDIAHYTAWVQIGEGPYDVIKIHRVVKEDAPYKPVRTRENVFLLHGDAVGFVKFLFGFASPSAPDDRSAALYLAQNGVDVWGMDQDWAMVPGDETEFSFMADWGLQRQVDNVLLGVELARYVRLFSGNGFGKINLLGYSSGGLTGYAAANQEAQLPPGRRDIGGLIPVDIHYKFGPEDEAGRQVACAAADGNQALLDGEVYANQDGSLFLLLSELATTAPNGESPIFPGMTNLQAAMFFVGATYQIAPFTPSWHYMGATFGDDGLPVDLVYTTIDEMTDFLATASPVEPVRFIFDYLVVMCDEDDSPFDDHFGEISIPILYLGAGGGIGTTGNYTTTLLASDDVTVLVPHLRPEDEILMDIGHIDIWTAETAEETFWQPLLEWISDHD